MTPTDGVTRRGLLGGAASLGIGAGLGYATKGLLDDDGGEPASTVQPAAAVQFHGRHQAGIATPAPEFLSFAAAFGKVALGSVLQRLGVAAPGEILSQIFGPSIEEGADESFQGGSPETSSC